MAERLSRPGRPAGARERGVALVLVLWVIALLAVIALAMVAEGRTGMELIRGRIDEARFRALTDAAVNYAVIRLTASPATEAWEAWEADGMPHGWRFAGVPLEISVFDERSRIDLNRAKPELLGNLLRVLEVDDSDRDLLVDAIMDWRDADDLHRLNGAEDPDYADAERPYGSRDGDFESVQELRQVLGMTPELVQRMEPFLTLYGRTATPDLRFADPTVTAAVRGQGPEAVATPDSGADDPGAAAGADAPRPASAARRRGNAPYRIRVKLASGGREAVAEVILEIRQASGSRDRSRPGIRLLSRNGTPALTVAPPVPE